MISTLFLLGLGLMTVNLTYSHFMQKFVGKAKADKKLYEILIEPNIFVLIFTLLLLSGVEELFFRYFLIGGMVSLFGHLTFFIVISTVVFTLAHVRNHTGNYWLYMTQALGGFIFAYVFVVYGFLAAWGLHFGYNFILASMARIKYAIKPYKIKEDFDFDEKK